MTAGRADADAIEASYPGWRVELSALGRWYAAPEEPVRGLYGLEYRPSLGAEDADGVRAALAAWGARPS